jgi:hypothetical protein
MVRTGIWTKFVAPLLFFVTSSSGAQEAVDDQAVKGDVASTLQQGADAKRERALKLIKRKGGRVDFDFEYEQWVMQGKEPSLEQLFEAVRKDSVVKVRHVSLSNKPVNDDDLQVIVAELPELDSLLLRGTNVSVAGLEIISELSELSRLSLGGLEITGAGLAHLQALPRLTSLYLDESQFRDDDLIHLRGLKSLKYLGLSGTPLSDNGLAHLTQLTQLTHLYLNDTAITAEGLRFLKELPKLEVLRLDESVLS